jgi:hypothetical protein
MDATRTTLLKVHASNVGNQGTKQTTAILHLILRNLNTSKHASNVGRLVIFRRTAGLQARTLHRAIQELQGLSTDTVHVVEKKGIEQGIQMGIQNFLNSEDSDITDKDKVTTQVTTETCNAQTSQLTQFMMKIIGGISHRYH